MTSRRTVFLGMLLLVMAAYAVDADPSLVGYPKHFVSGRFVPGALKRKALNAAYRSSGFSRNELLEMANDPDDNVRRFAYTKLIAAKERGLKGLLLKGIRDSDSDVRIYAVKHLRHEADDDAIPVLIAQLKTSNENRLDETEIESGMLLESLTHQSFGFTSVPPMFCGTGLFEGGEMISRGRKLGGAAGEQLQARGQAIIDSHQRSVELQQGPFHRRNAAARRRVLAWWDSAGHIRHRSRGAPVEGPKSL